MRLNVVNLSLAIILLYGCGVQKTGSKSELSKEISSFLGDNYQSASNDSGNMILAWKMLEEAGTPILKYAVWETETRKLVYSAKAIRGKVSWLENDALEVYDYPGIIDDENPLYRYKIDLNTKSKTPLSEKNRL